MDCKIALRSYFLILSIVLQCDTSLFFFQICTKILIKRKEKNHHFIAYLCNKGTILSYKNEFSTAFGWRMVKDLLLFLLKSHYISMKLFSTYSVTVLLCYSNLLSYFFENSCLMEFFLEFLLKKKNQL